jgi:glycosyltransferase involved in cell wall biosynthesis
MAEPMSVLHVVDCLNVGGTERQLYELLRRMDRTRYRPLLACFKTDGELLGKLRDLGIEPQLFPLRGSLAQANTAFQITRMAMMIRSENVKVVHAHDFYSNVIGVAAASLAGARSIASRRDLAHWLGGTQRKMLRVACRMADAVIANAAAVAEQTERDLAVAPDKMHIVPNGIDVAHFDLQAFKTPEPLLPAGEVSLPRIGMVGSMHLPDKGHAELLEAAAILKARGVRAQYLFVSDGGLRPELEAKAQALGLADDVVFLGRRTDVPSVLVRCDVIAHPSWSEGFPNAVLEAMCAARPVVATRVGGIPEVLTDGVHGLLVEPQRPAELASAIEKILANPLAGHVMGLRGRQHVEREYSLDKMRKTVEALYEQLAGGAITFDRPLQAAAG